MTHMNDNDVMRMERMVALDVYVILSMYIGERKEIYKMRKSIRTAI